MFVSVGSASTVSRSACDAYEIARVPTVMVKAVQTSAVSLPLSKVVVATQYMPREAGVGASIRSDFSWLPRGVPVLYQFWPKQVPKQVPTPTRCRFSYDLP